MKFSAQTPTGVKQRMVTLQRVRQPAEHVGCAPSERKDLLLLK